MKIIKSCFSAAKFEVMSEKRAFAAGMSVAADRPCCVCVCSCVCVGAECETTRLRSALAVLSNDLYIWQEDEC